MRTRRYAGRLVAVVTAVAALAGCSTDRLGSAVVIEGEAVSTQHVQELAQEYEAVVPGSDSAQVQLAVLQQIIVGRVFREIAEDTGVRVSNSRVTGQLDRLVEQVGGRRALVRAISEQTQQIVAPGQLEQWMRARLLFAKFAEELEGPAGAGSPEAPGSPPSEEALDAANKQLTRYARRMDIEVNPRYGRWDPDNGITPLVSGGLSRTTAELTGGAS